MTTPREAADVRKQGAGTARAAAGVQQLGTRTVRDTRHVDRVDEKLAQYYKAIGRAERIRVGGRRRAARVITTARRKADEITAKAELEAAGPDAEARGFIRDLHNLVGGRAEVAELCGLTVKAVTDMLAAPLPRAATDDLRATDDVSGDPDSEIEESGDVGTE